MQALAVISAVTLTMTVAAARSWADDEPGPGVCRPSHACTVRGEGDIAFSVYLDDRGMPYYVDMGPTRSCWTDTRDSQLSAVYCTAYPDFGTK
jgi:hypothetical protein